MAIQKFTGDFEQATRTVWRELADKALKGRNFDDALVTTTADGLRVEPLYTREQGIAQETLNAPGIAPFMRGGRASEASTGWDIREHVFASDPVDANAVLMEALHGGATSVTLPVAGPNAAGVVPEDLPAALKNLNIDMARLAFEPGERASDIAAALKHIFTADQLKSGRIDLNADPIGTLARSGSLGQPAADAIAANASLFEFADGCPNIRLFALDGRIVHEAGGTPAQELAFVLSSLAGYLREYEVSGRSPADVAKVCVAHICADADFFPTIAKVRALRVLIWRLLDACGAGDAAADVTIHAATSHRMMAKYDPWVNSLRTTMALTGAAIGGAQAISVAAFSVALGRPDGLARRIARNSQVILQEESNLGRVNDQAGGSWYVDRLTLELAEHAWSVFQDFENAGGVVEALASGHIQGLVSEAREAANKAIRTGLTKLTGVTAFPQLESLDVDVAPHLVPLYDDEAAVTVTPLAPQRLAGAFEQLRDAAEKVGDPPSVAIFTTQAPEKLSKQVNEARSFLASGGLKGAEATALGDGVDRLPALIVPGPGDALADMAGDVARLRKSGDGPIMVMARAGEARDALQAAGVTAFVHEGVDLVDVLKQLHSTLGVPTIAIDQ